MHKRTAILLALLTLTSLATTGAAQAETLRVGVRVDAAPFAWKQGSDYKGLIVDLCRYALQAAHLSATMVDAEGLDRLERLVGAADGSPRGYDMLCDPTSITLGRAEQFYFSPPIFVSGGSYARSKTAHTDFHDAARKEFDTRNANGAQTLGSDGTLYGAGTLAAEGTSRQTTIPACDVLGPDAIIGARVGHVTATTGEAAIARAWASDQPPAVLSAYQTICSQPMASHAEAVEALCTGKISFHFGDRDIIDYYLRTWTPPDGAPACDAQLAGDFYTSEPYAIAISPELPPQTVLRINWGILTALGSGVRDTGAGEAGAVVSLTAYLFAKYFRERQMSNTLSELYTILRVPE